MRLKVIDKQFNCPDCFVCGTKNPFGLNTRFYILEDDILVIIGKGLEVTNINNQLYTDMQIVKEVIKYGTI